MILMQRWFSLHETIEASELAIYNGSVILSFILLLFLAPLIHEYGHLIGGKRAGYHTNALRVGKISLTSNPFSIRFLKNDSILSGQCVMSSKFDNDPTKYIRGGIFASFIAFLIGLGLLIIRGCFFSSVTGPAELFIEPFLFVFTCMNFAVAIVNLIPFRTSSKISDGAILRSLKQSISTVSSFNSYMRIQSETVSGKGVSEIKTIPQPKFANPIDDELAFARYLQTLNRYISGKGQISEQDVIGDFLPLMISLPEYDLAVEKLIFHLIVKHELEMSYYKALTHPRKEKVNTSQETDRQKYDNIYTICKRKDSEPRTKLLELILHIYFDHDITLEEGIAICRLHEKQSFYPGEWKEAKITLEALQKHYSQKDTYRNPYE